MQPESYLRCPCKNCGGNVEFPEEGIGQSIACPHCGEETELVRCVVTSFKKNSPRKRTLLFAGLIPLALAAAIAFGFFAARQQPEPATKPVETASETQAEDVPTSINLGKSPASAWNDLKPGKVTLEKAGSRLIYAVGAIRNESDRQRRYFRQDNNQQ